MKQAPEPGFEVLMDLTGVDYLEPAKSTLKLFIWLHNPDNYETSARHSCLQHAMRPLPSVTDLWEGADWYERELL